MLSCSPSLQISKEILFQQWRILAKCFTLCSGLPFFSLLCIRHFEKKTKNSVNSQIEKKIVKQQLAYFTTLHKIKLEFKQSDVFQSLDLRLKKQNLAWKLKEFCPKMDLERLGPSVEGF